MLTHGDVPAPASDWEPEVSLPRLLPKPSFTPRHQRFPGRSGTQSSGRCFGFSLRLVGTRFEGTGRLPLSRSSLTGRVGISGPYASLLGRYRLPDGGIFPNSDYEPYSTGVGQFSFLLPFLLNGLRSFTEKELKMYSVSSLQVLISPWLPCLIRQGMGGAFARGLCLFSEYYKDPQTTQDHSRGGLVFGEE